MHPRYLLVVMEHFDPRDLAEEARTKRRLDPLVQGGGDDARGSGTTRSRGGRVKIATRKEPARRGGRAGAQGIRIKEPSGGSGGDDATAAVAQRAIDFKTQAERDEERLGKKIDPRTCPRTPPRIELTFGRDQV